MQRTRDIVKRSRQRQTHRRLKRLLIGLLVIVVLAVGLALASHYHRFLIQDIEFAGNKTVSAEELGAAVEAVLDERYYLILPKRNKWLYPNDQLAASLAAQFPRLAAVEIKRAEDRLILKVAEREGLALWCQDQANCFFVDDAGYIFMRAPKFTGHPFFVIEAPVEGNPIGRQPLVSALFDNLLAYRELLTKAFSETVLADAQILGVKQDKANDWQLTVAPANQEAQFIVRFSLERPATISSLDLAAALGAQAFISEYQRNPKLEYLDLRFLPKVFYKFREEYNN